MEDLLMKINSDNYENFIKVSNEDELIQKMHKYIIETYGKDYKIEEAKDMIEWEGGRNIWVNWIFI